MIGRATTCASAVPLRRSTPSALAVLCRPSAQVPRVAGMHPHEAEVMQVVGVVEELCRWVGMHTIWECVGWRGRRLGVAYGRRTTPTLAVGVTMNAGAIRRTRHPSPPGSAVPPRSLLLMRSLSAPA